MNFDILLKKGTCTAVCNTSLIMVFCILLLACKSDPTTKHASFDYFTYSGKDTFYDQTIDTKDQYFNPILKGFYPDPSICRKGNDYYLVTSSFSFYPGVPLFHSTDLVNWKQLGHVLDRPSQLHLDGLGISQGVFAPAISYNPHNQTFYMITTIVGGINNFLVKTKDIHKAWSDPILLPTVGGIDPSLFFDNDGKAYIVHNDTCPEIPQWQGHRAIWIHQYDVDKDIVIGEPTLLVNGGVDPSTQPVWVEAPHIYKHKGYYYLMTAEGGTSTNHSEVIFRSKNITGPYLAAKANPILTQRNLPEDRINKVTSTGHADIIETADGNWWAVFLACRPYEGNFYNTGRETFLLPVSWEGEFPCILPPQQAVPLVVTKANLGPQQDALSGNFAYTDNFNDSVLAFRWNMIRTPHKTFYTIADGKLILQPQSNTINMVGTPSFIGVRQQHTHFEVLTEMAYQPKDENDMAGMVCFQNETHYLALLKTIRNGELVMVLQSNNIDLAAIKLPAKTNVLQLKVTGQGGVYHFYVSYQKNVWEEVGSNIDAKVLSTERAGGFVGSYIGLYATGQ